MPDAKLIEEEELNRRHRHLQKFFSSFDDCEPCTLIRYRFDDELTHFVVRCDGSAEIELTAKVKYDADPNFKEW